MTDDLGLGDLPAFHPASPVVTPNLDQLAGEGMMLTQFRSAAPICSPTRAALLTGQDPATFGIRTIVSGGATAGLEFEYETLAEVYNGAGYDTHHVGKWHLGGTQAQDPITAGFQTSVRSTDFYKEFEIYTDGGLPVTDGQPNSRDPRVWEDHLTDGAHTTEVFTDEAVGIIADSAAAGQPFLLNLWYNAPHVETGSGVGPIPWQLPEWSPLHGDPTATAAEVTSQAGWRRAARSKRSPRR